MALHQIIATVYVFTLFFFEFDGCWLIIIDKFLNSAPLITL